MRRHPAELPDNDQRFAYLCVLHVGVDSGRGCVDATDEQHLEEGLKSRSLPLKGHQYDYHFLRRRPPLSRIERARPDVEADAEHDVDAGQSAQDEHVVNRMRNVVVLNEALSFTSPRT